MSVVRKSNVNCCVVNCTNTYKNTSENVNFYTFPVAQHKSDRRKQWIIAVNRKNPDGSLWQPKLHSRICSAHFLGNAKSEKPLNPSYIPTIFPEIYKKKKPVDSTTVEKRHERYLKRKEKQNSRSKLGVEEHTDSIDKFPDDVSEQPNSGATSDKAVQVNFLELESEACDSRTFICNHWFFKTIRNEEVSTYCDAEIQTYLPVNKGVKFFKEQVKSVDRSCGPEISYVDRAVGLDVEDQDSKGYLACKSGFHGVSSITTDQEMLDIAGVTVKTFELLLKILPNTKGAKVGKKDRLLIMLIKMKCGLTYSALGVLFSVHRTTISRIFLRTVKLLAAACREFVLWPSREVVQSTMPQVFKDTYGNCRVIIDCTEIRVQQPPTVEDRVHLYSHYKKGFTLKFLVGCTPGGLISFVSKCYGGRTSDSQITNQSGFLDLLEPGDVVLADKGFPGITSTINENGHGILLVMPPFLRNPEFSEAEVEETYKVASLRIHIERIMQRIRIYDILNKLSISMFPHADDIVFMCSVLVNLQPPIIKNSDASD